MQLSRKQKTWATFGLNTALPLVVSMSGIQGFWPSLLVCLGIALGTLIIFWKEITHLRIVRSSNAASQAERPLWLFLPGVATFLIALYPFVNLYMAASGYIKPLTPDELLQKYIHDRAIYVADLARSGPVVEEKYFENVTLVGPAVITFLDHNNVDGFHVEAYENVPDTYLLDIPMGTQMVGFIGFRRCVFRNVRLVRVQVGGQREALVDFREQLLQKKGK